MANQQKGSKGIKACSVAQWFDRFDYVPASLEGAENLQAKKNMQTHLMRHVKASGNRPAPISPLVLATAVPHDG